MRNSGESDAFKRIGGAAAALSLVVGLLGASPALASAHRGPQHRPDSALALAHAPSALRAAIRKSLGAPRPAVRANGESPQAELPDPGTMADGFGYSVAVSGTTAVVGAAAGNSRLGAAYVFTRSGTSWAEQTELTASDGAPNDAFGFSVAISGSTIVVGAAHRDFQAGAVYVFTGSGANWIQQAELNDPGTGQDYFGSAVAIAGSTIVVGANGANNFTGTVYMFSGSGSNWTQQAAVTAPDGASNDNFGSAVGVSGSTAVVGARDTSAGLGGAYIFTRTGTLWAEQAELTDPAGSAGDNFGFSVAVSGSTIVVGAPGDSTGTGAAYVFTRSGARWAGPAKLMAADGAEQDSLGWSVAVSGVTVVAGALGYAFSGAAYAFTRSGATWNQEAELTASDTTAGDNFAFSVAVSGATALVGAPAAASDAGTAYAYALSPSPTGLTVAGSSAADHFGGSVAVSGATAVVSEDGVHSGTGAVDVFTESGSTWKNRAELTAANGAAGDGFGYSAAIAGSTLAVGAPGAGAVYVFTRSAGTWSQQSELTVAGAGFGDSVALSGSTLIVGAPGAGAVYVFTRSDGTWTQQAELTDPGATAGDHFGSSVALSAATAVVGAPGNSAGTGAAYVFTRSDGTWTQQAELTAADGAAGDYFGWSVGVTGATAVVGADGSGSFTGAAYVFTGSGGTWTQQAELTDPGATQYDYFGSSVAVSGTTAVVGAYGSNAATGAAYVFTGSGGTWTQQRELTATRTAAGGDFGWSIALSGSTAVASALGRNTRTATMGTAYAFRKV